jgi:hypothetical protein
MARYGMAVSKLVTFRGGAQHFSNVYYYSEPGNFPDNATLELVGDQIVTHEKTLHSTNVTFDHLRIWSQIGTPSQNQMLVDKSLSGAGAASPSTAMDLERAFLVRYRAGVDSRGRPVYLRKWWHLGCGTIGGVAVSNAQLVQTTALDATQRTALETFANLFKSITKNTITFSLVAKSGREITGATEAHRYLEHHQFGDEWRG